MYEKRFKAIALYPNAQIKIGDTISAATSDMVRYNCEEHPHIFREMHWWEEIPLEHFPKYVKKINKGGYHLEGDIMEVTRWGLLDVPDKWTNGIQSLQEAEAAYEKRIATEKHKCRWFVRVGNDHRYSATEVIPSTREEYEAFRKSERERREEIYQKNKGT